MSADRFREAAALLRGRAKAATPGPWERSTHYRYKIVGPPPGYVTIGHVDPLSSASRPDRLSAVIESTNGSNGDYIAMMHPPVALALADWLDHAAEASDYGEVWPDTREPLAVADAILGGDS